MTPRLAKAHSIVSLGWLASLLALAAAASAQVYQAKSAGFDRPYQDELLRRPLSQSDQSFCSGKKACDACTVTRNYLVDINKGVEKGFPPLADLAYTRDESEEKKLVDRLP